MCSPATPPILYLIATPSIAPPVTCKPLSLTFVPLLASSGLPVSFASSFLSLYLPLRSKSKFPRTVEAIAEPASLFFASLVTSNDRVQSPFPTFSAIGMSPTSSQPLPIPGHLTQALALVVPTISPFASMLALSLLLALKPHVPIPVAVTFPTAARTSFTWVSDRLVLTVPVTAPVALPVRLTPPPLAEKSKLPFPLSLPLGLTVKGRSTQMSIKTP